MLAMGFLGYALSAAIIGISLLLIGIILLQKNKGAGLSGAFGGVGGHSAFGTKTGDFLTWFTVGLATLFLLLCIAGNFALEPTVNTPVGAGARLIPDGGDDAGANVDGGETAPAGDSRSTDE